MKKYNKGIVVLICILTMSFQLFSPLTSSVIVEASTIKLSKSNLSLYEGKTATLKMEGTSKQLKWSSSKETVATVNAKGVIKAKKAGTATINATVSGKTYKCNVTVIPQFYIGDYEEFLKSTLVGRYVDVPVNGTVQSFQIVEGEIIRFNIIETSTNIKLKQTTVTAEVEIDRLIATIKADVTYTFTMKSDKWALKNVSITSKLDTIALSGLWKGKYYAYKNEAVLELLIDNVTVDGYATATFKFYATPTNPNFSSGSFTMKGGIDYETGKIVFVAVDWIEKPDGYSTVDLYGNINLKNKSYSGFLNEYNSYAFEVFPVTE